MAEAAGSQPVGEHYARIRRRIIELLGDTANDDLERPVLACPGWRVRDVLAHVLGNVEDAAAGRLQGVPTEAMTAEQVRRHLDDDRDTMLADWARLAPAFEARISEGNILPAAIDLLSHEFDLRHALNRPGGRSDPLVRTLGEMFATLRAGEIDIVLDDAPVPEKTSPLMLEVSSFELVRLSMGRRTVEQVAALDWHGDPTDVLPRLFVFGPSPTPLIEEVDAAT